jgi:hypothetical protein
MTDKKAEIPFPQNAAAHQGNKDINGATRKATTEKKPSKTQNDVDSPSRVPFDLTLQFNDLIQLVINKDGENNPKNRPNNCQHGKNCHEHGDNCSAKNLGKRWNDFVPFDDKQGNKAH